MELRDVNFTAAYVEEIKPDGAKSHWWVQKGNVTPGGLEFHVQGEPFRVRKPEKEKIIKLYSGYWDVKLDGTRGTVMFSRRMPNGKPEDFPDQPDESTHKVFVTWFSERTRDTNWFHL